MTKYELWTMDDKQLVEWLENCCFQAAHGNKRAENAIHVPEQEILRRLAILRRMDEDMKE